MDPLLCGEEPTAIPNSALGPYFQGRSVGGIVETGHPKGNRKEVPTSGGEPVIISRGEEGSAIHSFLCGRQLAVWIQDSTA